MTVLFFQSFNGSHSSFIKVVILNNLNPFSTPQFMVYYLMPDLGNMEMLVKMLLAC